MISVLHTCKARCARRGFDAIPALIAHLDDDRLTRRRAGTHRDTRLQFYRVKDIVYMLLCAFAGQQLTDSNDLAERTFAAGRWFARLRCRSWVKRNTSSRTSGNGMLFPLLVEKVSSDCRRRTRGFIAQQERWGHGGAVFAKAIVERRDSVRRGSRRCWSFCRGYTRYNPCHREDGLRHLLMIDPDRGRELLLAELAKLGTTPGATDVWLTSSSLVPEPTR